MRERFHSYEYLVVNGLREAERIGARDDHSPRHLAAEFAVEDLMLNFQGLGRRRADRTERELDEVHFVFPEQRDYVGLIVFFFCHPFSLHC